MDTAQWPQGIGVVQLPMEGNSEADHQRNNKPIISAPRPQKTKAINCPRCNSTHTKFCYYNNYSLTQPRYFCKTCRRYWTEGGSLRNVPVGGTLRKNKRSSSSSSLISKKLPHQNPNIKIFHQGTQDLNLAYPPTNSSYNPTSGLEFPNSTTTTSHNNFSSGINGGRGFSSFMSMINPVSDSDTTGFLYSSLTSGSGPPPFQEFSKTSSGLNFSLNHQVFDNSGGYGSGLQGENDCTNHAKLLNFPFEDFKQPAIATITSTTHELLKQNQGNHHLQSSGLIWNNGGLGGGGASW